MFAVFKNDKSERLINAQGNENITLFNIEFLKNKNKYTLYFYPLDEHLNNEKLNIVTPNISLSRFDIEFNESGNIILNELRNFLEPIKILEGLIKMILDVVQKSIKTKDYVYNVFIEYL